MSEINVKVIIIIGLKNGKLITKYLLEDKDTDILKDMY